MFSKTAKIVFNIGLDTEQTSREIFYPDSSTD